MKKVMIVDDAIFMRGTLKVILERNGFDVVGEAENGLSALKKYGEVKPDIVTMDITMPQMDGLNALKMIKHIDPDSKVVMVSAMGQDNLLKEAMINGARGFITKPFKERIIINTLRNIR